MELLEDSNVEDIIFEEGFFEVIVPSDDFKIISDVFDKNSIEYDGEISLVPQNFVELESNQAVKIIKLLELIENHEDVQKVHTNFKIN